MRLIKIIFLITVISCKSSDRIEVNVDDSQIINDLIFRKKLLSHTLISKSLNSSLVKQLNEEIYFKNQNYDEFGDLRSVFSDEIIDKVFNIKQVDHFKTQLSKKFKWKKGTLKKIIIKDSVRGDYLYLSKPTYTLDKQFALIMYSQGNNIHHIGNSGTLLYKKENKKWLFINGFFNKMQ